ncbi:erythromycin esterase family protein [Chitinophaga sp.]|uniref:erythromycin esterase family protein n=1 Tax=Chitinophaga sp. TaxID=1869181 RepID=UPI0031D2563E
MNRVVILLISLVLSVRLLAQPDAKRALIPLKIKGSVIAASQLQPLINSIGDQKIVGLGEGTHGTKEFNELRINIIKQLVEKKGFRIICFENAFGDCYYFDQWINSDKPIDEGMKKYLIALWQTRELEGLFEWVRNFNKHHADKVMIAGMDFNYIGSTAGIIHEEARQLNNASMIQLAQQLCYAAEAFDSAWNNQMKGMSGKTFALIRNSIHTNLHQIDSMVKADRLPVTETCKRALFNGRCWLGGEEKRDSGMANMAVNIAQNGKTVLWAHAVHLALKSPFSDNTVGGCGGLIKKMVPAYYSLGMGTAEGSYGGLEDRFDTRLNVMHAYELPAVTKPSWDEFFLQYNIPAFYMDMHKAATDSTPRPLRLIGYGPPKSISYSDEVNCSDLFDGYIFIKHTTAPEYIP